MIAESDAIVTITILTKIAVLYSSIVKFTNLIYYTICTFVI